MIRRLLATIALLGLYGCVSAGPASRAAGPDSLAGNWQSVSVGGIASDAISLRFGDDLVEGELGCNRFEATYTYDGARIVFGEAGLTALACRGVDPRVTQGAQQRLFPSTPVAGDGKGQLLLGDDGRLVLRRR